MASMEQSFSALPQPPQSGNCDSHVRVPGEAGIVTDSEKHFQTRQRRDPTCFCGVCRTGDGSAGVTPTIGDGSVPTMRALRQGQLACSARSSSNGSWSGHVWHHNFEIKSKSSFDLIKELLRFDLNTFFPRYSDQLDQLTT